MSIYQPAFAAVTQIEEAPGQMLYQSRQNLRDRTGKSWQVVAFKRVRPDGSEMVSLRLVGFLGAVELDHNRSLTLTTSMGQTLTAKDVTSGISQGATALANVGEFDIQTVLIVSVTNTPVVATSAADGLNAIQTGLKAGDKVVTDGQANLVDGAQVKVKEPGTGKTDDAGATGDRSQRRSGKGRSSASPDAGKP